MGAAGAQGPVGSVGSWTHYRNFRFGYHSAQIRASDQSTANDIAAYMAKNPSLQIGIDATDPGNQALLGNRRADAVRGALVQAGVPSYKIQTGAFGDPQLRSNGRVEVLLSTHLRSSN
jgi:outer membrane protein OmpA-like peptidoglycan-associated protein